MTQTSKTGASDPAKRIAVIMPCYNPGSEISWTLDSLRDQSVPFKLFVTDDGSRNKPDYRTLLRGFNHELIELPQNVGVCTVRNRSIQNALDQGFEYIAIIDCGDWAHPARLEMQQAYLDSRPDIAALGSAVEILGDDMSYDHDYFPPVEPEPIRSSLFYGLAFKHPAMMFRASLLRRIGLYSPNYDAAEDYDLVRRAARVADLANLPQVLMKKVESANSVSSTRRTNQLVSRLRIQWLYREPARPHFWLGIIKTLVVLCIPTPWVARLRRLVNSKRAPRIEPAVLDAGPPPM